MLVIDSTLAGKVRGISPIDHLAAIDPVPIKDGTFFLPEAVLADPAHADVRGTLSTQPTGKTIDPGLLYTSAKADTDALAARNIPSYNAAGIRKADAAALAVDDVSTKG